MHCLEVGVSTHHLSHCLNGFVYYSHMRCLGETQSDACVMSSFPIFCRLEIPHILSSQLFSAVNFFLVCFDIDRHSDSFSMMRMWDLLCEILYSNIYESLHSLSLSLLSVLIAVVLCIRWLAVKQMILCISFLLTLELKWLCLGPANWQKELQTKKELQRQTLVKWKIPGKARNQMDLWLEEIIAFRFCQVLVRCYPALA